MEFSRPVLEIIKKRVSHRTFQKEPIAPDLLHRLKTALENSPRAPFQNPIRLALLDSFEPGLQGAGKLGTYGVIRGARNFIVGASQTAGRALEDFGYLMEWAVLAAGDLGLSTCWLGGTLKRDAFGRAIGLGDGEVVPAVIAVGHARKRRGLLDSSMRLAVRSSTRKPWSSLFFRGDFSRPLTEESAGNLAPAMEAIRLAPSASNKQPWRLLMEADGRKVHFYLRSNPGYQRVFAVDLQRIDLGICMCHFDLTVRQLGVPGHWESSPPRVGRLPMRTRYVASWIGD